MVVSLLAATVLGASLAEAAAPAVPTGVAAASASPSQINVNWTTVPGALAYGVLRSTTAGGTYSLVGMSYGNTFSNTGLTAGTTYYYAVESYNGAFSAKSSTASATTGGGSTPQVPPNAPTGLTATETGNQVNLSWTASTGAAVYHYNILRGTPASPATTGGEVAIDAVSGSVTTYTDASPPSAGGLTYEIVAVGAYGSSGPSNEVFVPGAPTLSLQAPPIGPLTVNPTDSTISLSWTASTGATGYNILRGTTSGGETALVTVGSSPTTYTDSGLTKNTQYFYVVQAVSSGGGGSGTSLSSNELGPTTTAVQPPTGLGATAVSASAITVSWTAATGTSPDATGYTVYYSTTNPPTIPGSPTAVPSPNTGSATSAQATGLLAGTTYYFQVVTSAGSNGSSAASAVTQATTYPAPPTSVSATTASTSEIDINWTASTSANATGYTVYYSASNPPYPSGSTLPVSGGATTFTQITGLATGTTTYYFQVVTVAGVEASAPAPASAIAQAPSTNPYRWWKLTDGSGTTALDSSGNVGGNGTLTGSPLPTWTNDATEGEVLGFDGSSSDLQEVTTAGFSTAGDTVPPLGVNDSFSWTLWCNLSPSNSSSLSVIAGNRLGGSDGNNWIKFTPSRFEYVDGSSVLLNCTMPTSQWVSLIAVKNGSTLTYYANGTAVATGTITAAMGANPFLIGGGGPLDSGEFTDCLVHDVRLYPRALSAGEIATLSQPPLILLTDGDFSNGFTGWTVNAGGSAGFSVISNGQQSGGADNFTCTTPHAGVIEVTGPSDSHLQQTVTIPANATTLTWDMRYDNQYGTFISGAGGQCLSLNILNSTTQALLATPFITTNGVNPQSLSSMTPFSANVTAYQGQTVIIDFYLDQHDNYFDVMFDNFAFN